jgi:CRISPR-associated protein Cmr4
MIIERLVRDLTLAKKYPNAPSAYGLVPNNAQAKVCVGSPLTDPLVLEEYEYTKFGDQQVDDLVNMITSFMPKTTGFEYYVSRLSTHFAVLSDTDFAHVVKSGTEIVTRIKLNNRKTTTGDGNMWTEEFLPSDCLFYSVLLAMPTRKDKGALTDGKAVIKFVKEYVKPEILQVGGDETVGRGWMRITFWNGTPSTPAGSTPTGGPS